jgi:hypothetical protein
MAAQPYAVLNVVRGMLRNGSFIGRLAAVVVSFVCLTAPASASALAWSKPIKVTG